MNFPLPDYGYRSVYGTFTAVVLEQTLRCRNNCIFCAKAKQGHANATMTLEDLDFALAHLPTCTGWVSLSGSGDAMLVDDLPERIARIKAVWPDCQPIIITALTCKRNITFFRDLFTAGLEELLISCYGHTEEDYKKLHGSSLFPVVRDNLHTLGLLPESMTKKIVLRHFRNAQEVFAIHNAEEKANIFFDAMRQYGINRYNPINCFPWKPGKKPDGHALWELPSPCPVLWGGSAGQLIIHYDLDVVPCCMMFGKEIVLGNLRRQSLEEIFTGATYRSFYEKWRNMRPGDIPYCNTCQLYPRAISQSERARMAAWQARDVRGRKIVFWGAGEAYRAYKSFFADCEPVVMLVESQEREREREKSTASPSTIPPTFSPRLRSRCRWSFSPCRRPAPRFCES